MIRSWTKLLSHSRVKHCCARPCVRGYRLKSTIGREDNYDSIRKLESHFTENRKETMHLWNEIQIAAKETKNEMMNLAKETNRKIDTWAIGLSGLLISLFGGTVICWQQHSASVSSRLQAQDVWIQAQNKVIASHSSKEMKEMKDLFDEIMYKEEQERVKKVCMERNRMAQQFTLGCSVTSVIMGLVLALTAFW